MVYFSIIIVVYFSIIIYIQSLLAVLTLLFCQFLKE